MENISLRDYFAGQALQGLIASCGETQFSGNASFTRLAYEYADVMLIERERNINRTY